MFIKIMLLLNITPNAILKDYVDIRLEIYDKRKKYYIKVLENEMSVLKYRKKFIESILSKKIIIEKRKKTDIIQDLIDMKYPELATTINGKASYDYLTNLPLFSLTQEKIDELNKEFNEKSEELELYKKTTVQDLWINELNNLLVGYKKWYSSYEEAHEQETKDKKINKSTKNLKKDKDSKINVVTEEKVKSKTSKK